MIFILLAMMIVSLVFIYFWPFLWQDPIKNFMDAVIYYKGIGTGSNIFPGYQLPAGFNSYPLIWILTTTPPWILFLSLLGVLASFIKWKDKDKTPSLWLLWLVIPILRVSVPKSSIYGGVRQIFEYIPAMALLAAYGAKFILDSVKPKIRYVTILILY